MDLEERKKALRQEIKAAAAALDEGYTKEADLGIFSHVAGLPEYEQAGTLFCFVGTSGEIDTAPILEDALRKGKRVGVPKCTAREMCIRDRVESYELEPVIRRAPETEKLPSVVYVMQPQSQICLLYTSSAG